MASATGLPQQPPHASEEGTDRESEPLLGRPGDALQKEDQSIAKNLVTGTFSSDTTTRCSAESSPPPRRLPLETTSSTLTHTPPPSRDEEIPIPIPAPVKAVKFWTKKKLIEVGTGTVAQIALGLLFIQIYFAVFVKNPNTYTLFSAHPLLQTFGVFILVQAILLVQPTHTQEQKRKAAVWHGSLNLLAFLSFAAGVSIIEYNKGVDPSHHFKSVHGYLGIITSALILIQFVVGVTMWLFPGVYGGLEKAKALYKYHRLSGYVVVLLLFATFISAAKTDAAVHMLKLNFFGTLALSLLVLTGIYPRLQLSKFGRLAFWRR